MQDIEHILFHDVAKEFYGNKKCYHVLWITMINCGFPDDNKRWKTFLFQFNKLGFAFTRWERLYYNLRARFQIWCRENEPQVKRLQTLHVHAKGKHWQVNWARNSGSLACKTISKSNTCSWWFSAAPDLGGTHMVATVAFYLYRQWIQYVLEFITPGLILAGSYRRRNRPLWWPW